jgi:hypothetical protein
MQIKRKAKRISTERRSVSQTDSVHQKGFGTEMPPQKRLVEIYFDQKELSGQAQPFYSFYEQADWSSPKGTPYRNWKLLAADWAFEFQQAIKLRKRQRENALSI